MLVWAGASNSDWYTYIRTNYNAEYKADALFNDANWNSAVHDGYMSVDDDKPYTLLVKVKDMIHHVSQFADGVPLPPPPRKGKTESRNIISSRFSSSINPLFVT